MEGKIGPCLSLPNMHIYPDYLCGRSRPRQCRKRRKLVMERLSYPNETVLSNMITRN